MEQKEWGWWYEDEDPKPTRKRPEKKYLISGDICNRIRLVTICKRVLDCSRKELKNMEDTELLKILQDKGYSAEKIIEEQEK